MTTRMLSVGLSVDPSSASTLSLTPLRTSQTLTVGQGAPGGPIASVSGGVKPYSVALSSGSSPLPAGLELSDDKNGNIFLTGTPTAAVPSNLQILIDVSDSAPADAAGPATVKAGVPIKATGTKKVWGEK